MSQENDKPTGKTLFKKGQSGNVNGRPAGVPNRITTQMRETMHDFFMNNRESIQADYEALSPKDRLNFISRLFPYFMPSLTATKSEVTVKHTGAEHLGSQELHQLILTLRPPLKENEDTTDTE